MNTRNMIECGIECDKNKNNQKNNFLIKYA